jgi:hypothetical protein
MTVHWLCKATKHWKSNAKFWLLIRGRTADWNNELIFQTMKPVEINWTLILHYTQLNVVFANTLASLCNGFIFRSLWMQILTFILAQTKQRHASPNYIFILQLYAKDKRNDTGDSCLLVLFGLRLEIRITIYEQKDNEDRCIT